MEAHPGIVFRSGPAGRRAGLARGPDVWEVIGLLTSLEQTGDERIAETAAWLGQSETQIRTAVAYYGEFAVEIDAEIEDNRRAAERARAAFEAEQRLLG
jgi:hypothetical protein